MNNNNNNNNYYDYYDNTNDINNNNGINEDDGNIPPTKWNSKLAPKKKGVSYSDILASMSMQVVNGKLQMVPKNTALINQNGAWNVNPYNGNNINPYFQNDGRQVIQSSGAGSWNNYPPSHQMGGYASQYGFDDMEQQQQQIPLTPRDRQIRILQERAKIIMAQKHIAETKSRKLFFSGNATNIATPAAAVGQQPPQQSIGMAKPRPLSMRQFIYR